MVRQLRIAFLPMNVFVILIVVMSNLAAQSSGAAQGQQMTNIPYFSLRNRMTSTLTLNNNQPAPAQVNVTIYSSNGKGRQLPPITLKPQSITDFSLADLLTKAGEEFDQGNIAIQYQGKSMGVTAQVGVSSTDQRVSFESREQDMMDFMSSKLNGIVSLPYADADGFLAVTNAAASSITVQLTIGSKKKAISLSPRETQVVDLNGEWNARETQLGDLNGERNQDSQHPPPATLIQLQQNGKPGDIVTTGFVLDLKNGYSSSFTMLDPSLTGSSKLAGAHLRFGKPDPREGFPEGTQFSAPLLVANVGSQAVTAHVSVDYTIKGQAHDVAIQDLTIAPETVQQIELAGALAALGVTSPVDDAGVDISYDGAPGTLIGQLTSRDQSGDYSFEMPVKDPAAMTETVGGSYPWTLEGGANTILHLKNTTDTKAFALLQFHFPDGGTYNPDRIQLEPHQTVAIDIQKLKDSNKTDVRKQVFPSGATHGQLVWLQQALHTLIGRAEQINVQAGIARSFSCGYFCNCPENVYQKWMNPSSSDEPIGWSGTPFTPYENYKDCGGTVYGPYLASGSYVFWASDNSSVASVNSSGVVSVGGSGSANISFNWTEDYYVDNHDTSCSTYATPYYAQAAQTGRGPDHVRVITDTNGYPPSCPSGYYQVYRRLMYMQVVDSMNRAITNNVSVKEVYTSGPTTNNCPGGGQPSATSCLPTSSGTFTDILTVAGTGGPGCSAIITDPSIACGFSDTATWPACSNGYSNNLWTSPRSTLSNGVTANSNSSTFSSGTQLYP